MAESRCLSPAAVASKTLLAAGLLFLAIVASAAPDAKWEAGVEPSMATGDYGTGTRTTVFDLPFSLRRFFADGDVGVVIPYVTVIGNGSVTLLGGAPNQSGVMGPSGAGSQAPQGMRPSSMMSPPSGGQTHASPSFPGGETKSGLGDVILKGRYTVLDEDAFPSVDVTGRVKLPTADRAKALGTGRFDEGLGFELSKELAWGFSALAGAGYTFIGNPPGEALRDQWDYSAGLGYDFTKEFAGTLSYEEYRALVAGTDDPRSLSLSLRYRWSPRWRLSASGEVGLSKASPDAGLSAGVSARF